jgi:hypothetical protein
MIGSTKFRGLDWISQAAATISPFPAIRRPAALNHGNFFRARCDWLPARLRKYFVQSLQHLQHLQHLPSLRGIAGRRRLTPNPQQMQERQAWEPRRFFCAETQIHKYANTQIFLVMVQMEIACLGPHHRILYIYIEASLPWFSSWVSRQQTPSHSTPSKRDH